MKKSVILLLGMILVISACEQKIIIDDTKAAEPVYEDITNDPLMSSDYTSLVQNIDALLNRGDLIGPRHYDDLKSSVNKLENGGVDVSELRKKLAKLSVASRQGEEEPKEEFIPEAHEEDFKPEESPEPEQKTKIRRRNSEIPTEEERQQLPDCENVFFSTPPVDLSEVTEITPLGNLGPPGHTVPTDHTYIGVGERGSGKVFELFAPADVYITSVSWSKGITQDPIDYTIYFALCKDVIGYYNHVKSTSIELNKLTDKVECED